MFVALRHIIPVQSQKSPSGCWKMLLFLILILNKLGETYYDSGPYFSVLSPVHQCST